MKKKIKIIFALVILLLGIMVCNHSFATDNIASGTCGNNITWSLSSTGTLTITGDGSMSTSGCAWEEYKDQVKNVEFNGKITGIPQSAFKNNTNLETITLPSTVVSIGTSAFQGCTKLKTVEFPKSIMSIGDYAFYGCTSLQEVDLPEGLAYIRQCAFAGCTSLKKVTTKSIILSITDSAETISDTATICAYEYSNMFYYARYYGRKFTNLATNKTTQTTITPQSYLDALPKINVKAEGVTSHNAMSYHGATFQGYSPDFCNEKNETNETYKEIKAKVDELTQNCSTEKEKARKIYEWVAVNVKYQGYGATAKINVIYDIFKNLRGNCESYTMLTNYMLYLCGIPVGTVTNVSHEWSVAYVDGEWIYIDSTQGAFDFTRNRPNHLTFAYDGLVYAIDDPLEGGMVTGIAQPKNEIEKITSFTIPTNSYMKGIYLSSFNRISELKAEIGTIGEKFIRNNKEYCKTNNNQIIGRDTPFENPKEETKSDLPFTDVELEDWFYNAVEYTYKNKIISGYNETTFAPNDKLTRGMIVTMLYKMEGSPSNDGKSKFVDVKSDQYYAKAVKWAVEKDIVHGYNNSDKFGPNDYVLRQDLAGMLRNYARYKKKNTNVTTDLLKYSDYKNIDDYASKSMQWAVEKGVITGNANGTLAPKGNATRAEAAAMIQKYCQKVGR